MDVIPPLLRMMIIAAENLTVTFVMIIIIASSEYHACVLHMAAVSGGLAPNN